MSKQDQVRRAGQSPRLVRGKMHVPRGIYYEEGRNRYRVRLYYNQKIIWRTYHQTIEAAVAALDDAKTYRRGLVRALAKQAPPTLPTLLTDLMR